MWHNSLSLVHARATVTVCHDYHHVIVMYLGRYRHHHHTCVPPLPETLLQVSRGASSFQSILYLFWLLSLSSRGSFCLKCSLSSHTKPKFFSFKSELKLCLLLFWQRLCSHKKVPVVYLPHNTLPVVTRIPPQLSSGQSSGQSIRIPPHPT